VGFAVTTNTSVEGTLGDGMDATTSHSESPNLLLDGMSIFVQKDKETEQIADYFFTCDVYTKDPRFKSRKMCVGQRRGLFRVHKLSLSTELLFAMELDSHEKCFQRATGKILQLYTAEKSFPATAQFTSG
jgi:hypothetical protein